LVVTIDRTFWLWFRVFHISILFWRIIHIIRV
jgi:hypothetical protein